MGAYWEAYSGEEESINVVRCQVARQGRHLQRYSKSGGRLIVGCIPYRFKNNHDDVSDQEEIEVLVISSQKGHGMMFPKGGWELDETKEEAASREGMEEAGVQGNVEESLGKWSYKSKRYGAFYEVTMFPMNVCEQLDQWPEMDVRCRRWVSVAVAMEGCQHSWMKEALDRLVKRLSSSSRLESTPALSIL